MWVINYYKYMRNKIRNYIMQRPVLLNLALKAQMMVNKIFDVKVAFGWNGTVYTPKFKVEAPILGFSVFKLHDDKIEFYTLWNKITVPIYRFIPGCRIRQLSEYGYLLGTKHRGDDEYVVLRRGEDRVITSNTMVYLDIPG